MKGDTGEAVVRLKEQPGKDLFVFGSADLSAALIRHGLFDEYRIGLVPVTLGEGNSLFKRDSEPLRLELLQSRWFAQRYAGHELRWHSGWWPDAYSAL